MSTSDHNFQDLSKACWRCAHWGGFAFGGLNHSKCSRLNASPLQAYPATGCAFWQPGPGDSLLPGWKPVGFVVREGPTIYGKPLKPLAQGADDPPQRPGVPSEQFAFDTKLETVAWRMTDELLSRARRG